MIRKKELLEKINSLEKKINELEEKINTQTKEEETKKLEALKFNKDFNAYYGGREIDYE